MSTWGVFSSDHAIWWKKVGKDGLRYTRFLVFLWIIILNHLQVDFVLNTIRMMSFKGVIKSLKSMFLFVFLLQIYTRLKQLICDRCFVEKDKEKPFATVNKESYSRNVKSNIKLESMRPNLKENSKNK